MITKNLNEVHLPFNAFEIVRLGQQNKVFGYLDPKRANQPPAIVMGDGQNLVVIPLGGKYPFRHFSLQAGSPLQGLLIQDIEFRVDLGSQFDPNKEIVLGAMTIEDEKLNVISIPAKDAFNDPISYPIDEMPAEGGQDFPAGFRQWSIVVPLEGDLIELWRNDGSKIEIEQ